MLALHDGAPMGTEAEAMSVIDELFWYFVHAESDCEVPFLLGALHLTGHILEIPGEAFDTTAIARARKIRHALSRMPERWHRVLSKAFEPRAFRHAWQRVGKAHETELASIAVCTLAFRLRFDDTSNDGDHPQRYRVTDKWTDADGTAYAQSVNLDGVEAYLLSLEKSKIVRRASRTAAKMLAIAIDQYQRAKGGPRGGKRIDREWKVAA